LQPLQTEQSDSILFSLASILIRGCSGHSLALGSSVAFMGSPFNPSIAIYPKTPISALSYHAVAIYRAIQAIGFRHNCNGTVRKIKYAGNLKEVCPAKASV